MSSHREAPGIARDPVADNTDVYAFVSPDDASTVTLIANYIPLEEPAGGPYFHNFGDDVLYSIYVDNDGDGKPDVTYEFQFTTTILNPDTFLYNTGPITSLTDPDWSYRQTYRVTQIKGDSRTVLGENLPCPPANIGPRSTPNYATALVAPALQNLGGGRRVFAGPRAEGFVVDTGSIFDLLGLRPFNSAHLITPPTNTAGVNGLKGFNVHSIALQVPKSDVSKNGDNPTDVMSRDSVIGVWASASRRTATMREDEREDEDALERQANGNANNANSNKHKHKHDEKSLGAWRQVSRLGEPLVNEALIPTGTKDMWNRSRPHQDEQFVEYYRHPELAKLMPVLYPTAFPNLAALNASGEPREDIVAVLLTGVPSGLVPGFQNYTGPTKADEIRLNLAIPPGTMNNRLGVLGGDLAGFPNGRRVIDDVVTIELRTVAGVLYPLIDPAYVPDAAAGAVTDGAMPDAAAPYLTTFPFLATPYQGYSHSHD